MAESLSEVIPVRFSAADRETFERMSEVVRSRSSSLTPSALMRLGARTFATAMSELAALQLERCSRLGIGLPGVAALNGDSMLALSDGFGLKSSVHAVEKRRSYLLWCAANGLVLRWGIKLCSADASDPAAVLGCARRVALWSYLESENIGYPYSFGGAVCQVK